MGWRAACRGARPRQVLMRYIPHTTQDISRMLNVIGVKSVEDLFASIPQAMRYQKKLDLPEALSEAELFDLLRELGAKNKIYRRGNGTLSFAGAGIYAHSIPSTVDMLSSRSEFYTAYTPYQPELAQGTLLGIFEFQTIVAELMGMSVANASMYDGASATAEAIFMARRITGRQNTLLSPTLHPEYQQTCSTYMSGFEGGKQTLSLLAMNEQGQIDLGALKKSLNDQVAAVVVQTPNFFGLLEDLTPIAEAAHQAGALLIAVCPEPLALALAKSPGASGADIAVGEGIGFAGLPNLGGPGLGMFAVRDPKNVRSMPGRLVGQTVDSQGRTGYVLTLSTREQHIRREKATSNICTNHGLMALRFTMHLALLGKTGFDQLARLNLSKTAYASEKLSQLSGFSRRFNGPFFNELALRVPGGDAQALIEKAAAQGVLIGVSASRLDPRFKDTLLVSFNENHRRTDIDRLASTLKSLS